MKLTRRNYHSRKANEFYMSSSQFKSFLDCEARTIAELRGRWKQESSTAMLVGSYVDAYFSNELAAFKKKNPQIFTKAGELKAEFRNAENAIARIKKDRLFMLELSGEKQVILTGMIAGVPYKCRIDSLRPDSTNDLKVMADLESKWNGVERVEWWRAYRYDTQGAVYQTLRSQTDGEIKPFRLDVATKQAEPKLAIFEFSPETLRPALDEVKSKSPRFQAIKDGLIKPERCETCAYCRATQKLTKKDIIII